MNIIKVFLFAYVLTCLAYSGDEETKYVINAPEGYHKISKETVEFLTENMSHPFLYPGYSAYDYLFQRDPLDTLFVDPYILVQINERDRINLTDLQEWSKKYYKYDDKTNYLWQYRDNRLNVIIPTNYGSLNVYCYAKKENFEKLKSEFENFVNSIEIKSTARYNPTVIRDSEFLNLLFYKGAHKTIFTIAALLIGIIVALILKKSYGKLNEEGRNVSKK